MSLWCAERVFSGPTRDFCLICPAAATAGSSLPSAAPAVRPALSLAPAVVSSLALKVRLGSALFSSATAIDSPCAPCDGATGISKVLQRKHFKSHAFHWHGTPSRPLHTSEKTTCCCSYGALDRISACAHRSTAVTGRNITEREKMRRFSGVQWHHATLNCNTLSRRHLRRLAFPPGVALPLSSSTSCSSPLSSFRRASTCSFSCRISYSAPSLPSLSTSPSLSAHPSLLSSTRLSPPSSSASLNSHFVCNIPSSLSLPPCTNRLSVPCILTQVRLKMVKSASYRRPPRASPTGQARKPHIGPRRLSAEYVTPGVVLVKQRKFVAFNLETKRRKRHFKMYPGENVGVTSSTHLVSLAHGRVKYTHDVSRDVMIVNVLPERKEELLREDLWRYRTEHVRTVEENRHVCFLRMKATRVFPKELVNPPTKPELRPYHFTKRDTWENPTLPDVPIFDDDR